MSLVAQDSQQPYSGSTAPAPQQGQDMVILRTVDAESEGSLREDEDSGKDRITIENGTEA